MRSVRTAARGLPDRRGSVSPIRHCHWPHLHGVRNSVRALEGGDDALLLAEGLKGLHGLAVGGADVLGAAAVLEEGVLGADTGVVETGRDGVRLVNLACVGGGGRGGDEREMS